MTSKVRPTTLAFPRLPPSIGPLRGVSDMVRARTYLNRERKDKRRMTCVGDPFIDGKGIGEIGYRDKRLSRGQK